MARTESTMIELGTPAPAFQLPEPATGNRVQLSDFSGQPLVVAFICNHCPYVIHIRDSLFQFARDFQRRGLAVVAISANDSASHPQDGPEAMAAAVAEHHMPMPYLYDESQSVARAYQAACTPDFFLFDAAHQLVYRGQYDGARPANGVAVSGVDLRQAAEAVLSDSPVASGQVPSMGCNIKWKPGNEPDFHAA